MFSTCSISAKENKENADYIESNLGFKGEDITPFINEELLKDIKANGGLDDLKRGRLQLLPGIFDSDGFFLTRWKKTDIKSLSFEELNNEIKDLGEKSFRAKQIYDWLHVKLVRSFDEMTNLSQDFRNKLKERYSLTALEIVRVQESKIDGTRKYLFKLADGNLIESVWMIYKHGNSVCVSSQVGCRMGCRFCASTIDGLERNLNPSEILDQIYSITLDTGERVSNVVVMGSGEPMDNYDNTVKFVRMLSDEHGLNISQRNITVSTCGIVPKIRELANEDLSITLAISLHATTDEKRRKLMPIANKYSISEIKDACLEYFDKTGRRLTFEYSLVGGVNDTDEDADELAAILKQVNGHVNLIPVNPIKERDFVSSTDKRVQAFKNKLEKKQINVTIRREMGRDIDGACGQLRRSVMHEE
ncbi:MAG: 23S rRNA (adenine(2503)-C(2))-methyltransferase RlmN [Lachnospiraceae bacterium]|nr:23S rRNA (adenine(2503)-C(2))-methyltransferase RlmN [Lachnospiraceae bacterium]